MKREEWIDLGKIYLFAYFGVIIGTIVNYDLFGILFLFTFLAGLFLILSLLVERENKK